MKVRTVALAVLGLTLLLAGTVFATPASTADDTLAGEIVCLDPGHGGSDPGATNGEFSLFEKEINLEVAYGLQSLLEREGADVVMTRTDNDAYLTNEDRYTFCNEQQATILVSVHTNSARDETWDGSMTLYASASRDAGLARAIQGPMYEYLLEDLPTGVEEFTNIGVDNFASGVLFKCDMPAAMVEPVLMSHPAEAAALVQTIYDPESGEISSDCRKLSCRRGQIAQAIRDGVLNYFENGAEPEHPGRWAPSP